MAIVRMISRDPAEFRAFQTRMTTVGKIRLGVYATPEGKRGRPEKIDTFRFTSPDETLIRAIAQRYGGEARGWTPQGARTAQWEVISDESAVPVYLVNGQQLEPWYEMWAAGRTCVRRCDGEINKIDQTPCVCNGPDRPQDTRQLCKPTIRAMVMLPEVPGIGSWMLESHGENACAEISTFAPLAARAPMPIPAMLRLRKETRREWNFDKGRFDTKDFYVPWFDVSAVTSQQIAIGGDALTTALAAAGAPVLLGGDRRAIEAGPPMSAPPVAAPYLAGPPPADDDPQGGAVVSAEEHARILVAVEKADTIAALDELRAVMVERKIRYRAVQDAWVSKRAAVMQAAAWSAATMAETDPEGFAAALDALSPEDREELRRRIAARDDRPVFEEAARDEPDGHPRPDDGEPSAHDMAGGADDPKWDWTPDGSGYAVGDTVTVGGMEFTKIADNPFPGSPLADALLGQAGAQLAEPAVWSAEPVEGDVEGAAGPPMVPAGQYTVAAEWPQLMTLAGKFDPPLTTDQVRRRVNVAFDLNHIGEATGEQLARVRAALAAELEKTDAH